MSFDVAKLTVTSLPAAADKVTVKFVEVLLSFVVETSLIDNDGVASLSVMVKVAVESLIEPFDAQ